MDKKREEKIRQKPKKRNKKKTEKIRQLFINVAIGRQAQYNKFEG